MGDHRYPAIYTALGWRQTSSVMVMFMTDNKIMRINVHEAKVGLSGYLPLFRRDPFDRLLVSQAIVEGLALLTPDQHIRNYGVRAFWWSARTQLSLLPPASTPPTTG